MCGVIVSLVDYIEWFCGEFVEVVFDFWYWDVYGVGDVIGGVFVYFLYVDEWGVGVFGEFGDGDWFYDIFLVVGYVGRDIKCLFEDRCLVFGCLFFVVVLVVSFVK